MRTGVCHGLRMGRRTNLILPDELVAEVDRIAGPRMRSAYVAEAVEARLQRDRLKEVVERTAGVLDPSAYPYWSSADDVVAWVRALRAEVTGPVRKP